MFLWVPPTSDRKIKSMRVETAASRRGDETRLHVMKGLIPVNPVLLREIQERISNEEYATDREKLILDIKKDPGLFTYCIRNLSHYKTDSNSKIDPIAALRGLEEEQLHKLFHVSERYVSQHRMKDMNKEQALRLQHSLLSSHAASEFATRFHLVSDVVFTTEYFRQLGMNLIAWNYPSMYLKASARHRHEGTLPEVELTKLLGISPSELGLRLATEWGVNGEIRQALSSKPFQKGEEDFFRPNIQTVCELSELFAQSRDPLNYPNAEKQWSQKQAEFRGFLDTSMFDEIDHEVAEALLLYEKAAPVVDLLPLSKKFLEELHHEEKKEHEINSFAMKCPAPIQQAFRQVYALRASEGVSLESIRILTQSVIPLLGFQCGCVYFMSSKDDRLTPALRMGAHPLSHYENLLADFDTGIESSLHSKIPIKKDGLGVNGNPVIHIFGPLNNPKHEGVLYLELLPQSADDVTHDTNLYFHAVREALNDFLEA